MIQRKVSASTISQVRNFDCRGTEFTHVFAMELLQNSDFLLKLQPPEVGLL